MQIFFEDYTLGYLEKFIIAIVLTFYTLLELICFALIFLHIKHIVETRLITSVLKENDLEEPLLEKIENEDENNAQTFSFILLSIIILISHTIVVFLVVY
jgi:hypothetical protein